MRPQTLTARRVYAALLTHLYPYAPWSHVQYAAIFSDTGGELLIVPK